MKPKLFIRAAAILMLLHTIGHTMGALTWKDAPNKTIAGVINGMQTNHFDFMGRSVTLAGFFEGYGIGLIGVLLLISVSLWLLSNDTANPLTSKLLASLMVFLFFFAVVEYIYFFPFAATITLLAAICSLFATIGLTKQPKNSIKL